MFKNNNIPKKIYDVNIDDLAVMKELADAANKGQLTNLIPDLAWFKLSDEDIFDAERLLVWLNVCDITNKLTSTFSYIPLTNEYGQSFVANKVNVGLIRIPVRDSLGRVVMETASFDPNVMIPKMVDVHNFALPPINISEGADAINWFEQGIVGDSRSNIANSSYIDPYSANELRRQKLRAGSINPTSDFLIKLALRQQGVNTIGHPLVETIYLPIMAGSGDNARVMEVPMAVEYDPYDRKLRFSSQTYEALKNAKANANKQSWNTKSADSIRLDTNLESIGKKITDPEMLKEYYSKINNFAEKLVDSGNSISPEDEIEVNNRTAKNTTKAKPKATTKKRGRKPKIIVETPAPIVAEVV